MMPLLLRPTMYAIAVGVLVLCTPLRSRAQTAAPMPALPTFEALLRHDVKLKPALNGVHPRVFVTAAELETMRTRAKTTHRESWARVLQNLAAIKGAPPAPPGPQERRSQNVIAFTIAEISLAYQIERKPEYLDAAKRWVLAAIDYEPWGYTFYKPNVDLAAGHLLYAIGWAYDLLYNDLTPDERARIRRSLERHAARVYDYFAPAAPNAKPKQFNFTQNHDFIPTAGLAITALALLGESADAPKWAALARAHHHRAGTLLSPDGYYYEGIEYWIFSAPWLVHFLDAWEHSTGESLWEQGPFRHWPTYLAHVILPDGEQAFDFGDVWEGPLTRARGGQEYGRVYPGGRLESNFNLLYRIASKFRDGNAQAVAARSAAFGHRNLEEYWTLLWRDDTVKASPMSRLPLSHYFQDSGVVFWRSSWDANATAFAIKAGPPEGHAVAATLPRVPEWSLSSGHAHPDVASFILYGRGRYLTGDTGYAGVPQARHHNTITIDGVGQGQEAEHDVWDKVPYARLDAIRILEAKLDRTSARVVLDATAAYPESTGLARFTRRITLTSPDRLRIEDDVTTTRSAAVDWYLQSDTPFAADGNAWTNAVAAGAPAPAPSGQPSRASLLVTVASPASPRIEAAPTRLTAPGRPGSITEGSVDERGHHLVIHGVPATQHRFDVTLTIREGS